MAGITPVQNGQHFLSPQHLVQTTNANWPKTAATVATIAIGILTSIGSFFFLPAEIALATTGFITAAAIAIYNCIKRCFPNPTTVPAINLPVQYPLQPIIPTRVVPLQPVYVPPNPLPLGTLPVNLQGLMQQGQVGRGSSPARQTVPLGQGHLQPIIPARVVPLQPVYVPPTPLPLGTLPVNLQGLMQQGQVGRGPSPANQTVPLGQVLPPRVPQPRNVPNPLLQGQTGRGVPVQPNPFAAFAQRVTDVALPSINSGTGGTIRPGMGSGQPLAGPTIPVGGRLPGPTITQQPPRQNILEGRGPPPMGVLRPDTGIGSTIRIGAGSGQVPSGPTVGLGNRKKG